MKPIIAYHRVSTKGQGASGLGLEAQDAAVNAYARSAGREIVKAYVEVESGRRNDRPELAKAIAHARRIKGTLVIAKLDRLSRDPDFLGALMRQGVDFIACDMPEANKLTIRIMAAVAEQEREAISKRTAAALAAAKARGTLLGSARPECRNNLSPEAAARGRVLAAEARKRKADEYYADLYPFLTELRGQGLSLQAIADRLTADGYTTRRGRPWNPVQVKLVLDRAASKG